MGDLISTLPEAWTTWGILIIFGLPVAIIIAGELLHYLETKESAFTPVVYNVRNILLPNLALYLILTKIIKLGSDSLLLKIVATLFWLVLIHSSLKFVNTLVFSEVLPNHIKRKIPKLLIDFIQMFLVLFGAAIIASVVWGADLGKLLAALGLGSIVLGLALQDVIGGLFSGILLISSRPFRTGDWISVGDVKGKVTNIDWRAVTIEDFSGDTIIIPNAGIAKDRVKNYSQPTPIHREELGFDISFDDPPNKVKDVLLEVMRDTPDILKEPEPQVALISYDEFSIHYEARYFISDYGDSPAIYNDFISRVWYANKRYNITFPTRAHEVYNFDGEACKPKNKTTQEIQTMLKESKIFSIPDSELLELAKHSKFEEFGVGECLLHRGLITENIYLILNGVAKEHIENKNGQILHDRRLRKGDIFGLSSLVQREPSLVTVCALSDIDVIAIDIHAMRDVLKHNPDVAQSIESMSESHERKVEKSLFKS